jgi:hypothetical protein
MTTSTITTSSAPPTASRTSAAKVAAGASTLFAVALFLCVASVNVPRKASDAELVDWWKQSGNLNSGLVSELFAILGAVFFVVVVNYVRTLAAKADAGAEHWMSFAHSMATAFASTLLVSSALRAVIGHLVQAQDGPLPGIDVLRYSTALNYTLIGTATMTCLALAIVAVSVVVIRARILGSWVAYVGFGCAAVILVAVGAMMGAFAIPLALVWAISLAVAIWRQPTA